MRKHYDQKASREKECIFPILPDHNPLLEEVQTETQEGLQPGGPN